MNLLPASLFGRLFGALFLAVVITVAVMVLLVVQDRRQFAVQNAGGDPMHRIALLAHDIALLEPEARQSKIQDLRAGRVPGLRMEPPHYRRGAPVDVAATQTELARQLRRHLGDEYAVTVRPAQPANSNAIPVAPWPPFVMSAEGEGGPPGGDIIIGGGGRPPPREVYDATIRLPDGEKVLFRVNRPPEGPPLPVRLLTELGILVAVLGIVLFVTTRTITRPLSDLAKAADAVGRQTSTAPLRETGARELREATRAFNTMQDRLRRYLDSRTRVLAAMSHDMRTPLTRLRLRVETIDDAGARARFETDLTEMETMVQGALALFRDLNNEEPPEAVDVNQLLATLQSQFSEMGATVSLAGRANAPLRAQPVALKRCLTNLVENAIKFGGSANIQVEDGQELLIRVLDDGPGIPEASLSQVFEPFYRVEGSRSRDTGGMGLGLSIALDVAQAHGGTIKLMNRPTGGLEALVSLPR